MPHQQQQQQQQQQQCRGVQLSLHGFGHDHQLPVQINNYARPYNASQCFSKAQNSRVRCSCSEQMALALRTLYASPSPVLSFSFSLSVKCAFYANERKTRRSAKGLNQMKGKGHARDVVHFLLGWRAWWVGLFVAVAW
jgi:hypothetical protein